MSTELQITFNSTDHTISRDAAGLFCLTDLWKAAGADRNRRPNEWCDSRTAREFIAEVASSESAEISAICKSKRGRGLGVFAHWQVALAYAQWLSPRFHMVVNAAFVRYMQEERDPDLEVDRALSKYEAKGWDAAQINDRLQSIQFFRARKGSVPDRDGGDFANIRISQIANKVVLGKTAAEFKKERGLRKSTPTRDHMAPEELAAASFFEAMTARRLALVDAHGPAECIAAAETVGNVVGDAIATLSVVPEAAAPAEDFAPAAPRAPRVEKSPTSRSGDTRVPSPL